MKHPYKTTILMSNFNYAQYVEEALQSVSSQTVPFDETIIVDDGSTDGSLEIINAFAKDRSNVTVISQPNQGQLASINTGFAHSSGDIIYFLDSDDILMDRYLEKTLSFYDRFEDCDYLFTAVQEFGNSHDIRTYCKDWCAKTGNIGFSVLRTLYGKELIGVPTSAISIKRDILEKIMPFKNDKEWKICADDCLAFGASLAGARKYIIAKPLVRYRIHDSNQWAGQKRSKSKIYHKKVKTDRLISSLSQELNLTGDLGNLIYKEFTSLPNINYNFARFYLNLANRSQMYHKDKVRVRRKIMKKYVKTLLKKIPAGIKKRAGQRDMTAPIL
jgi:glycosyltransferase involved in cell wall biosynthesis